MGANQSELQQQQSRQEHGITVVHGESQGQGELAKFDLPEKKLPILSIQGHQIDRKRHKTNNLINPKPWINFVDILSDFYESRADLIARRQNQLQDRIAQTDIHIQHFTDLYINDEHKALARMNDDCKKIDELNKQLDRCNTQAELCLDTLEKLNFLLPEEHRLEPLETEAPRQEEITNLG